jgi:hypothetical protein
VLQDFGNASTVMYDGQIWQPLFLTVMENTSGTVNALYSLNSKSFGTLIAPSFMKVAYVILISLAIAFGIILLLVLTGLVVSYIRKRRLGYRPAPNRVSEVDMTETVPPANLLQAMGNVGGSHREI